MGPVVITAADVEAKTLSGNISDCVIQRLHVERRLAPELPESHAREQRVPAGGKVRAVELEREAGVGDRPVLVAHRLRHRN